MVVPPCLIDGNIGCGMITDVPCCHHSISNQDFHGNYSCFIFSLTCNLGVFSLWNGVANFFLGLVECCFPFLLSDFSCPIYWVPVFCLCVLWHHLQPGGDISPPCSSLHLFLFMCLLISLGSVFKLLSCLGCSRGSHPSRQPCM